MLEKIKQLMLKKEVKIITLSGVLGFFLIQETLTVIFGVLYCLGAWHLYKTLKQDTEGGE